MQQGHALFHGLDVRGITQHQRTQAALGLGQPVTSAAWVRWCCVMPRTSSPWNRAWPCCMLQRPRGTCWPGCCCVHCCCPWAVTTRSEEHTSELQSQSNLVCRLLLEKKNK